MPKENALSTISSMTSSDYVRVLWLDAGVLKSRRITRDNFISTSVSLPMTCEFRLTLTSNTPVTTSDVTGATNVYISPYRGNRIALYDGSSSWNMRTASEITIALGTLTSGLPYDVFVYDNVGTVTARAPVAWTNGTTRATALTTQNGVLVKSGATTDRYLGTFYTTATTTTEDSAARRLLFNYYNRINKTLFAKDTTDTWSYTTATIRSANGNTTDGIGRVAFVTGWSEDSVSATTTAIAANASNVNIMAGIGLDSTSAFTGLAGSAGIFSATYRAHVSGQINTTPSVGYHYLQRLEYSTATGTTNWYGDDGASVIQTGLTGSIFC